MSSATAVNSAAPVKSAPGVGSKVLPSVALFTVASSVVMLKPSGLLYISALYAPGRSSGKVPGVEASTSIVTFSVPRRLIEKLPGFTTPSSVAVQSMDKATAPLSGCGVLCRSSFTQEASQSRLIAPYIIKYTLLFFILCPSLR
nr:hypothetical protein [Bacteroides salyersiae]